MNFGKLNNKVDIEEYSQSRTSSGSYTKSWTVKKSVFAQIIYKSGGENIEADQEQGYNIVEFLIRKCDAISANEQQRVVFDGEYFDILYVNKINKTYMKLITKRKTVYQEK